MSSLPIANWDGQAGRQAGGRAGTKKYRDACASKNYRRGGRILLECSMMDHTFICSSSPVKCFFYISEVSDVNLQTI